MLNKVFQVGFNKCGTTSLHHLFAASGYRSVHWHKGDLGRQIYINITTGQPVLSGISHLDCFFDMVFMDADKANYCHYFDLVLPKLTSGAILIADNVLWSGKVLEEEIPIKDSETRGLKEFNKKVMAEKKVENLLLPIRDGLMICRKI